MDLFEKIINKRENISVIGLGYVGLPLAVAFAEVANVIGYDISKEKIQKLKEGEDVTKEVGDENLRASTIFLTSDEKELEKAKFHIVAVPTPINKNKTPDLTLVESASRILGQNLTKDSYVVYESTVYPGVTEEVCVPILEASSGLKCGIDFKIGYSPERINPGDTVHRLDTIVKVVSGMDNESLEIIAKTYSLVAKAGVFKAANIRVAEAAKVIENSQRDINIAFMNELSIILNKLNIDTKSVLEAARTKWNFLNFTPGLVGGHCIGVDPYYLTHKAKEEGYHSQIILAGRRINDSMGKYVAENTVKLLAKAGKHLKDAKIVVFGVTFKENCPDVRNSKVVDVIEELEKFGITICVYDPRADKNEVFDEFGIELADKNDLQNVDAVIMAVPHFEFESLKLEEIEALFCESYFDDAGNNEVIEQKILIDVKGMFSRREAEERGFLYWRL